MDSQTVIAESRPTTADTDPADTDLNDTDLNDTDLNQGGSDIPAARWISASEFAKEIDPVLASCHIASPWDDVEEFYSTEFEVQEHRGGELIRGYAGERGLRITVEIDRSTCKGHAVVVIGEFNIRWHHRSLGKGPHDRMAALQAAFGGSPLVWLKNATAGTRAVHTANGIPGCGSHRSAGRRSQSRVHGEFEVHSNTAGKVTKAELPAVIPSVAKTCKSKGSKASGWVARGYSSDPDRAVQSDPRRAWVRTSSWMDQSVLALPQAGGVRLVALPTAGVWEEHGVTPSGLRWGLSKNPGRRAHGRVPVVLDPACGRIHALSTNPDDFTLDSDGAVDELLACPTSESRCRGVEVEGSRLTQRDCKDETCSEATVDLEAVAKRGCR